jgi:hypothetical protein
MVPGLAVRISRPSMTTSNRPGEDDVEGTVRAPPADDFLACGGVEAVRGRGLPGGWRRAPGRAASRCAAHPAPARPGLRSGRRPARLPCSGGCHGRRRSPRSAR